MKKVGKQVLFLTSGKNNPRNGEGTFARLKDGRIMAAYTQYYGDDWNDHAIARICAVYSFDEGETWSEPTILIEKDADAQNIMSPSLIRLANGCLGMIFLRKMVMPDNGIICMPVFVSSDDEGKTWSHPVFFQVPEGYYCVINDGVTVSHSGRILVPASYEALRNDGFRPCTIDLACENANSLYVFYSDDNGKTWGILSGPIKSLFENKYGFAEPGIYEYENGYLWLYCRTLYGHQFQSFSEDEGKNWSTPAPNFCFTSPDSPMRVKNIGKYTVSVFNPIGANCLNSNIEQWGNPKRTPFLLAISTDDGKDFSIEARSPSQRILKRFAKNLYYLEDDLNESYCYPAIISVNDGLLVSYYHSNGTPVCLNSMKIVKIRYDEIEEGGGNADV